MRAIKRYILNKVAPEYFDLQTKALMLQEYERFFPKYLDSHIAKQNLGQIFNTNGEIKNICILFTDVRGFTKHTEVASLSTTNNIVNNFYDIVIHHTHSHGGVIDKFMGDGTMSIFGLINTNEKEMSLAAVSAAQGIMADYKGMMGQSYEPSLRLGVGISAGNCLVGSFGNGELVTFTAIGAPVNLAARAQAKSKDNNILVTKNVAAHLPDWKYKSTGFYDLKNISKPVELFEIN